jgi:hypothetical protein
MISYGEVEAHHRRVVAAGACQLEHVLDRMLGLGPGDVFAALLAFLGEYQRQLLERVIAVDQQGQRAIRVVARRTGRLEEQCLRRELVEVRERDWHRASGNATRERPLVEDEHEHRRGGARRVAHLDRPIRRIPAGPGEGLDEQDQDQRREDQRAPVREAHQPTLGTAVGVAGHRRDREPQQVEEYEVRAVERLDVGDDAAHQRQHERRAQNSAQPRPAGPIEDFEERGDDEAHQQDVEHEGQRVAAIPLAEEAVPHLVVGGQVSGHVEEHHERPRHPMAHELRPGPAARVGAHEGMPSCE